MFTVINHYVEYGFLIVETDEGFLAACVNDDGSVDITSTNWGNCLETNEWAINKYGIEVVDSTIRSLA